MRVYQNTWHRSLELLLRETARTLWKIPADGCYPQGYKSCMPAFIRDRDESYGYTIAQKGRPGPSSGEISRMDIVLSAVLSASLSQRQHETVWARARGVPYKDIAWSHGVSINTSRRHHVRALIEIGLKMIEHEQDRMVLRTLGVSRGNSIQSVKSSKAAA